MAQLIVFEAGNVRIAHCENRPSEVLTHDTEQAYTHLLSIGRCWIPDSGLDALSKRLGRDIAPWPNRS